MISSTAFGGIRAISAPTTPASLRAGTMSVIFTAISGGGENCRACATGLQQILALGRHPVERDRVAANERAIRIGHRDAPSQLATARATAVTGADERTRATRVRQRPRPLELGRGEHAVRALRA